MNAAAAVTLVGLALTLIGAGVAARAVLLSEDQADKISATMWNGNESLKRSLLRQSKAASWGLLFVAIGTLLQMIGVFIPVLSG